MSHDVRRTRRTAEPSGVAGLLAILVSVGACGPVSSGKAPIPGKVSDEKWRATAPSVSSLEAAVSETIRAQTLANGLRVYWSALPGAETFALHVTILAGSSRDPGGRAGMSTIVRTMLEARLASQDRVGLAATLDALGSRIEVSNDQDRTTIVITGHRRFLRETTTAVVKLLVAPQFSAEDLASARELSLAELDRVARSGRYVVRREFLRAVFGPARPYSHAYLGTREGLQAITLSEVEAYLGEQWAPTNTVVVVATAIDQEVLQEALLPFGQWPNVDSRSHLEFEGARAVARDRPIAVLVSDENVSQTTILAGWLVDVRSANEWAAIELLNYVFGRLHTSRLSQNLRERHGYTYYVRSSFEPLQGGRGYFTVAGDFESDTVGDALRELDTEMMGLTASPATAEELHDARRSATVGLLRRASTPSGLAAHAERSSAFLGLPELGGLIRALQEAGAGDLRAAAEKYLAKRHLVLVVRGRVEGLQSQLELAGFDVVRAGAE